MTSDMRKHPGTSGNPTIDMLLATVGMRRVIDGDVEGMRRFIEGFN